MSGYDPHFLTLVDKQFSNPKTLTTADIMKGLLVFSVDSQTATEATTGNKVTKVSIYHVSAVDTK